MKIKHFIILASIITVMSSCNYRTPSSIRFEKITGIALPDSITVIKDRFEETGPDYGLFYEFIITEEVCFEILENLEKSNDWKKWENSLEFQRINDGIIYNILIVINENKIIYREELI